MKSESKQPSDDSTTIAQLRALVLHFVAERDWEPFHSPKNLAMSLSIEAAELMEHFQWLTIDESRAVVRDPAKRAAAAEELADVLAYVLAMANALELDLTTALREKLVKNAQKYPVERSRGRYERPD